MAFGSSKHATGTSVAKAQSPVFFDPLFNHEPREATLEQITGPRKTPSAEDPPWTFGRRRMLKILPNRHSRPR